MCGHSEQLRTKSDVSFPKSRIENVVDTLFFTEKQFRLEQNIDQNFVRQLVKCLNVCRQEKNTDVTSCHKIRQEVKLSSNSTGHRFIATYNLLGVFYMANINI